MAVARQAAIAQPDGPRRSGTVRLGALAQRAREQRRVDEGGEEGARRAGQGVR